MTSDAITPLLDLSRLNTPMMRGAVRGPSSDHAERNAAAARLSNLASERLSRITVPITTHYDWERLRINVAHRVEPSLVKRSGKR